MIFFFFFFAQKLATAQAPPAALLLATMTEQHSNECRASNFENCLILNQIRAQCRCCFHPHWFPEDKFCSEVLPRLKEDPVLLSQVLRSREGCPAFIQTSSEDLIWRHHPSANPVCYEGCFEDFKGARSRPAKLQTTFEFESQHKLKIPHRPNFSICYPLVSSSGRQVLFASSLCEKLGINLPAIIACDRDAISSLIEFLHPYDTQEQFDRKQALQEINLFVYNLVERIKWPPKKRRYRSLQ